ncbi:MAG: family 20 glycosylhydrolase [Planctomycetota bacterium]|jgi:hypothetical protein
MEIRALNYDLARCRTINMQHLCGVIDFLAKHNYNMLSLYLEHRFDYRAFPGLAPDGSLNAESAARLVEYGREKGIAVIPQINLIGHCEGLGATERGADLTVDPYSQLPWGGCEQLNLEKQEARDFVETAAAEICAAFGGEYIHIGGDEIRQMENLFPEDEDKQISSMFESLIFIIETIKKQGKKIMMWGDMPLHYPELMEKLPTDILICDWNYGPDGSKETLEKYKEAGFEVLASPCIDTCSGFGMTVERSIANISKMLGDADDLSLKGFLLTTWEFGFGSNPGQIWPLAAFAGEFSENRNIEAGEFINDLVQSRYGIDSSKWQRLHSIISVELEDALKKDVEKRPFMLMVTLRKAMFRDASPFPGIARQHKVKENRHQRIWEPGPFGAWLFLRPIITPELKERLSSLAEECRNLLVELKAEVSSNAEELQSVFMLAEAMLIMIERLQFLQRAGSFYHNAASCQGRDEKVFAENINDACRELEKIRPGIERLKALTIEVDKISGLDNEEEEWLDIHLISLERHIAALQKMEYKKALLEFGEFLRRPAHITGRLTWR